MCSTLGFRQHRITTFVVTWIRRLRTVFREPSVPTSNASTAFKKPDQLHIRDQFVLVFCGPPCGGKSYLHEAFKRAHPQVSFNEMDQIRLGACPSIQPEPLICIETHKKDMPVWQHGESLPGLPP